MKKISFSQCLIIMAVLCTVVFSGCQGLLGTSVQKEVTVTGIPGEYNGKYGTLGFSNPNTGKLIALNFPPQPVSSGEVTVALIDAKSYKPFTKNGNYFISLIISDNSLDEIYWNGGILSKSISSDMTTLRFTEFLSVPVKTVRTGKFDLEIIMPEIIKELKAE